MTADHLNKLDFGLAIVFAGGLLASQGFDFDTEYSPAILVRLGLNGIGVMETSNSNETAGSRIEVCGAKGWIRADDTLTGAEATRAPFRQAPLNRPCERRH